MPSDTRTDPSARPAGFGFATVSVVVFLIVLGFVSGLVLAAGYVIARQAIERDALRLAQQTRSVFELVVGMKLNELEGLIERTAQSESLRQAMIAADRDAIAEHLSTIFDNEQQGHLDILFVQLGATGRLVDVSSQGFELAPLKRTALALGAFEMNAQMFRTKTSRSTLYSVLTRRDVIHSESGRVLGAVFGGLVLNDNLSLARELQQRSEAVGLALYFDDHRLVAYPPGEAMLLPAAPVRSNGTVHRDGDALVFINPLPPFAVGDLPVVSISRHQAEAFADLETNYRKTLYLLAVSTLISVAIAAWVLRRVSQGAMRSLSEFASRISRGDDAVNFEPSAIREFNRIGLTLETLVKALRDSEARAQTILNNASAIVYVKDLEGRYVFVNRLFELRVARPKEEILGRRAGDLLPADTAERLERHDREVLASGEPGQQEEVVPLQGERRVFYTTRFPLEGADGRVQGLCGIASDMTELKHSKQALQQALEQAELANAAKSRFLATMSHEFRTPLNAILGFSDLMRLQGVVEPSVEKFREYATDIHQSGEHMLNLVNDILDISTIEAGRRELERENIDIEALLRTCVRNMEQLAQEAGVRLSLQLPAGLPSPYADRRSLVQIVLNLLSNAIKFSGGDGQVTITAGEEEGYLRLEFIDNGVGIAADRLDSVTEPFAQNHGDPHLYQQGTGLGLSIVKALIDAHDGRLEIDSELGTGTRVAVLLPLTVVRLHTGSAER